MACATLKRRADLDLLRSPLHSPSKIRRYEPKSGSTPRDVTSPYDLAQLKRSLEQEPDDPPTYFPSKRRRHVAGMESPSTSGVISPFALATPKLTSEQIMTRIKEEMKKLNRRRQLYIAAVEDKEKSGSRGTDPDGPPNSNAYPNKDHEKLLSFEQVELICEQIIKEREDNLREIYGQILNSELAEQYEMFVKFAHDQVQKGRKETSSYLS